MSYYRNTGITGESSESAPPPQFAPLSSICRCLAAMFQAHCLNLALEPKKEMLVVIKASGTFMLILTTILCIFDQTQRSLPLQSGLWSILIYDAREQSIWFVFVRQILRYFELVVALPSACSIVEAYWTGIPGWKYFCWRKLICLFLGFTIAMYELSETIETLWSTVKGKFLSMFYICQILDLGRVLHKRCADNCELRIEFIDEFPQYIAPNNALGFISKDGGASYNFCHCELQCHLLYATILMIHLKFGAILRLPIWTSGVERHIPHSLIILILVEDSITRSVFVPAPHL